MESNAVTRPSPSLASLSTVPRKKKWLSETMNDDELAQYRREQAAERQRRKRERDRLGITVEQQRTLLPPTGSNAVLPGYYQRAAAASGSRHEAGGDESQPHALFSQPPPASAIPQHPTMSNQRNDGIMSADELERRERVRSSARERQRKHRAMVKMRKMDNGGIYPHPPPPPMVMQGPPPEHMPGLLQQVYEQQQQQFPPQASAPPPDQAFPPPQPTPVRGGQTFATTLLLSFSCAPLLKQHLLRTLNMTDDELASLEPVIADAWEQWDAQRRMYQELGAHPPPPSAGPADHTGTDDSDAARFRIVPQPPNAEQDTQQAQVGASGTLEDPSAATIDPSLPRDVDPNTADPSSATS